jgi:hypothetical protein
MRLGPAASSRPSTSNAGEILTIRSTDNGNWDVPGGAVHETREESGIECTITGTVGIYSDPRHVIVHTSNGEARQEFSIVLTGRPRAGRPRAGRPPSSGSSEVRWVSVPEVHGYQKPVPNQVPTAQVSTRLGSTPSDSCGALNCGNRS